MSYILVVDDDADARQALCRYLQRAGYMVEGAVNGKDALDQVLAQIPDAIVLDLAMPHMDGPGLLAVLRSYLRLQSLPVLLWTAYDQSPMLDRARRHGVSQTLLKPSATFREIEQALQRALHRLPPDSGGGASQQLSC